VVTMMVVASPPCSGSRVGSTASRNAPNACPSRCVVGPPVAAGAGAPAGVLAGVGVRRQVGEQPVRDRVGDPDLEVGGAVAAAPAGQEGGPLGVRVLGLRPAVFVVLGDLGATTSRTRRPRIRSDRGENVATRCAPALALVFLSTRSGRASRAWTIHPGADGKEVIHIPTEEDYFRWSLGCGQLTRSSSDSSP
jgi:hypothetical protein